MDEKEEDKISAYDALGLIILSAIILACGMGSFYFMDSFSHNIVTAKDPIPTEPQNTEIIDYNSLSDKEQQRFREAVRYDDIELTENTNITKGEYIHLDGEYYKIGEETVLTTGHHLLFGLGFGLHLLFAGILFVGGGSTFESGTKPAKKLMKWTLTVVAILYIGTLLGGMVTDQNYSISEQPIIVDSASSNETIHLTELPTESQSRIEEYIIGGESVRKEDATYRRITDYRSNQIYDNHKYIITDGEYYYIKTEKTILERFSTSNTPQYPT